MIQRQPLPEIIARVRIPRGQRLDGGEGRLRFLISVAHRVRLGQEHRGDEVGVGAGERRELGAEIGIAGSVRRSGALKREVRRQGSARVEPEPRRPQRIVRAERIPALEDRYQL